MPYPVLIEIIDVRQEVKHHRIARWDGLHLKLSLAAGTVVLPEDHPVWIRMHCLGVDLLKLLAAVSNVDQGLQLPVLLEVAELVATGTLGDSLTIAVDHVELIRERKEDGLVPLNAFLVDLPVFFEAIRILVRTHHLLRVLPRDRPVNQRFDSLSTVFWHGFSPP